MDTSERSTSSSIRFEQLLVNQSQRRMPRYRAPVDNSNRESFVSTDSGHLLGGYDDNYKQQEEGGGGPAVIQDHGEYGQQSLTASFSNPNQPGMLSRHQHLSAIQLNAAVEEEEEVPVSPLRQLFDAINMSILPTSLRLSSLAQAVEFFDHRDRAMHDSELREGAAYVLYHKLGLALRLAALERSIAREKVSLPSREVP